MFSITGAYWRCVCVCVKQQCCCLQAQPTVWLTNDRLVSPSGRILEVCVYWRCVCTGGVCV